MALETIFRLVEKNRRMTRRQAFQVGGILGLSLSFLNPFSPEKLRAESSPTFPNEEFVELPRPVLDGTVSVEKAIKQRRTKRVFAKKPLSVEQLAQILWAAQGITEQGGFKRASPSGGALYPIDVYAVVGKGAIVNLARGVYRYRPHDHSMAKITEADARADVASASFGQIWIARAPAIIVLTAEYRRITGKYGERGRRYAVIEVGHIGQNIFLQCEALGLCAGIVGAFDDQDVAAALKAGHEHEPLIIMPVGWPS